MEITVRYKSSKGKNLHSLTVIIGKFKYDK